MSRVERSSRAAPGAVDTGQTGDTETAVALAPRMMADLVVHSGQVVSMDDPGINDDPGTIAEAMAVRQGEILELTSNAGVQKWIGEHTRVIDLEGRTVIPGIIDPHSHLQQFTARQLGPVVAPEIFERQMIQIRGSYDTAEALKEDILRRVEEKVAALDDGEFVAAIGLPPILYSKFPDDFVERASIENPDDVVTYDDVIAEQNLQPLAAEIFNTELTKTDIEAIAPDNPVLIGIHPFYVFNEAAADWCEDLYGNRPLEHDDVETETPAQRARRVIRSFTMYRAALFDVFLDGDVETAIEVLQAGQEVYLMNGVTTYASHIYPPTALDAFLEMDRRDEVRPRMAYGQTNFNFLNPDKARYHKRIQQMRGAGTDFLWNTGVSLEAMDAGPNAVYTALECSDEVREQMFDFSVREGAAKRETLKVIAERGARFATSNHVVGDRTIDDALDIILEGSRAGGLSDEEIAERMHAMDHGTMYPRPDQIEKLKRYNVRLHLNVWESWRAYVNWKYLEKFPEAEQERGKQWFAAAKTALDNGLKVGWHGKELENPFRHIETHVTRIWEGDEVTTELAIDRVRALKMATTWNADYLLREDLGSLEPGHRADFLVLDRDYFSVPTDEIGDISPLLTVVDGEIHHDTGDLVIS